MAEEIVLEGVRYKSISSACDAYDISFTLVYSRLKNGWSVEEAFGLVERKNSKKGTLIKDQLDGYNSLAEFCRRIGVDYNSVRMKIQMGSSLEEAIISKRIPTVIKYKGVEYVSITSACRALDLDYYTVCMRLSNGWDMEDALNPMGRRSVIVNGVEYPSLKNACLKYNLKYDKVRYMTKSRNITPEEAINYFTSGFGKVFKSNKLPKALQVGYNHEEEERKYMKELEETEEFWSDYE